MDSITHTNFRTNFPTPNKTEIMEMGQIQDRCIHNFKQMLDPDLHTDLQPNLQADPPTDLQADLQMDLQANLQVRMDLQPDLQVHTQGLEATLQPGSPLVSFQSQAETLTGREKSPDLGEEQPFTHATRSLYIYGRNL